MNIIGKWLVLVYLTLATGSAAQNLNTASPFPSAVNEKAPLTQPLAGTLFFAQDQRVRMDRIRNRGPSFAADDAGAEETRSIINGFVKRDDGISTVWVDGAFRSINDTTMTARIQSRSVGMETLTIMAGNPVGEAKAPSQTRATAVGKKRVAKRQPDPAARPVRK